MKKNLISVLILALCFANLVLTALLIFTIIPETKKANNLIDQVCEAISLDLNSDTAQVVHSCRRIRLLIMHLQPMAIHLPSILPHLRMAIHIILFVAYHFHSTKRVTDIRPTVRICPPRKMLS